MRAQSICDLAIDDIERQRFARNVLVDRHDVEPVTCLDQFAQQAGGDVQAGTAPSRIPVRYRLDRFDQDCRPAAPDGQFDISRATASKRSNSRNSPLSVCSARARISGIGHRRRHLKKYVPRMHEIAAAEFLRMSFRNSAGTLLPSVPGWEDLAREQLFDARSRSSVASAWRSGGSERLSAIARCLRSSRAAANSLVVLVCGGDLHPVDQDAHDRIGSLARVRGVRTI